MLDLISIAVDLAADMPEFLRLTYVGRRPVVFRKGGAMTQYAHLMQASETPLLMLPSLPDAPKNIVPVDEVLLSVYPGGICWSGVCRQNKQFVRWESYTVTPEILERVAGSASLK